jgi:hypothetical protein
MRSPMVGRMASVLTVLGAQSSDALAKTLSKGLDTTVKDHEVAYVSVTGTFTQFPTVASESYGVKCYTDKIDQDTGKCLVLEPNGMSLMARNSVSLEESVAYISVTTLDMVSNYIVCYTSEMAGLIVPKCNALVRTNSQLSKGATLSVDTNAAKYISVTGLDATNAIICYSDEDASDRATCKALERSGTTLSKGDPLVLNDGASYISVTTLGATTAIICYRPASRNGIATCNALELSGTLSKGPDLVVSAGDAAYISVTTLDASNAIICYKSVTTTSATCNALERSGTTLSKGPNFVVSASDAVYISVTGLDATNAIICYSDETTTTATCNALELSGTTLSKGPDLVFNGPEDQPTTSYISVAASDASSAILCYAKKNCFRRNRPVHLARGLRYPSRQPPPLPAPLSSSGPAASPLPAGQGAVQLVVHRRNLRRVPLQLVPLDLFGDNRRRRLLHVVQHVHVRGPIHALLGRVVQAQVQHVLRVRHVVRWCSTGRAVNYVQEALAREMCWGHARHTSAGALRHEPTWRAHTIGLTGAPAARIG